jgi:hydroxyethylthiazole kinase-like uncharacterized protein yjeF
MSVRGQALFSVDDIRRIEHEAADRGGFQSLVLMERAAAAAWRCLRERWPSARRITVVCGTGNNAGDGYALARLAHADGRAVTVIQVGTSSQQGDAKVTWDRLLAAGIPVGTELSGLDASEVIVDALFGIGLNRPVAGAAYSAIEAMNAASAPCFSLDIPSGLDATTGNVLGLAIKAQATVCFIALKPGLVTGAGRDHTGALRVADLGVGEVTSTATPFAQLTAWRDWAALRRPRPRHAHKGDSGHVLLVGGAPGMAGAVRLAAEAALRTGAGLVSVAAAPAVAATLSATRPEIMAHGIDDFSDLAPLLARASVVAIGPGLGQSAWGAGLWSGVREYPLPMVVDADALNLLALAPFVREDRILTPHPGEAARLLPPEAAHLAKADRYAAAHALQKRYGGHIVLKGAGTVVETSRSRAVIAGGNPGMAVGGMGDVLTGIIAALVAQGVAPHDAAIAGPALHAAAGDLAAAAGERGMLASEVIEQLRTLVN